MMPNSEFTNIDNASVIFYLLENVILHPQSLFSYNVL